MAFVRVSTVPSLAGIYSLNPSNVPANTTSVETFTVKGLNVDGVVVVNAPSLEAGVILESSQVSAQDTLKLVLRNLTGADINPAAQNVVIVQF